MYVLYIRTLFICIFSAFNMQQQQGRAVQSAVCSVVLRCDDVPFCDARCTNTVTRREDGAY